MKNSHWTISAKKTALRNIVLRKMICPFGRFPWNSTFSFFFYFFRCSQRSVFGEMDGLSRLLERLAYPCRYSDIIPGFGRPVPEMSMMTSVVLDWSYNEHGHHLTGFNNPSCPVPLCENMQMQSIKKGAPLNNCWDFVNRTVHPICTLLRNQRIVYNGHKRGTCLVWPVGE